MKLSNIGFGDIMEFIDSQDYELEEKADKIFTELNEKENQIRSLEEQLKNAIVPKFKIGQEIWDSISKRYWKVNRFELTEEGWEVYRLGHDGTEDYNCCIMPHDEENIFATREEAEKRLETLKGENK